MMEKNDLPKIRDYDDPLALCNLSMVDVLYNKELRFPASCIQDLEDCHEVGRLVATALRFQLDHPKMNGVKLTMVALSQDLIYPVTKNPQSLRNTGNSTRLPESGH